MPEHGSVQFWDLGSSLIINGSSYTLAADIQTLATDINADPAGFYALAKPYDASADGVYTTSPISSRFLGVFEGLGNSIKSLSMNIADRSDDGFFSSIGPGAELREVGLENAYLSSTGSGSEVGLLVGRNDGSVRSSSVDGKIDAFDVEATAVGGLVGFNEGSIVDSYAKTELRITGAAAASAGALAGYNTGAVSNSHAEGSIAAKHADETSIGGLVGTNEHVIANSYSLTSLHDGRSNDTSYFGGLVGTNSDNGLISSSYDAGEIRQNSKYATFVGGLIGLDDSPAGNVTFTYWDLDRGVSDPAKGAGNISNDPGISGLTDAQLKSGLPQGFPPRIWGSDPNINNGYPYLLANPPQ